MQDEAGRLHPSQLLHQAELCGNHLWVVAQVAEDRCNGVNHYQLDWLPPAQLLLLQQLLCMLQVGQQGLPAVDALMKEDMVCTDLAPAQQMQGWPAACCSDPAAAQEMHAAEDPVAAQEMDVCCMLQRTLSQHRSIGKPTADALDAAQEMQQWLAGSHRGHLMRGGLKGSLVCRGVHHLLQAIQGGIPFCVDVAARALIDVSVLDPTQRHQAVASSSGDLTVSFQPGPPTPAAIDRPAGAAGTVVFFQQWTPLHGKRPPGVQRH